MTIPLPVIMNGSPHKKKTRKVKRSFPCRSYSRMYFICYFLRRGGVHWRRFSQQRHERRVVDLRCVREEILDKQLCVRFFRNNWASAQSGIPTLNIKARHSDARLNTAPERKKIRAKNFSYEPWMSESKIPITATKSLKLVKWMKKRRGFWMLEKAQKPLNFFFILVGSSLYIFNQN